jgi:hypothetical protein
VREGDLAVGTRKGDTRMSAPIRVISIVSGNPATWIATPLLAGTSGAAQARDQGIEGRLLGVTESHTITLRDAKRLS